MCLDGRIHWVYEKKIQKWDADDPPYADHTQILRINTDLLKQKRMITDNNSTTL